MAKAAITVKKLHYTYPNSANEALNNVSLTIKEQEFVTVIGQTGSGKSTLVSLIDGLIKPSSGELNVAGLKINATTKPEYLSKIHHQVGFVFQFPEQQLFAETVAQDVAFGPRNLGWPARKIEEAVNKALKMVDLPLELKSHSPFALSGGQMRRVAIAGVLAMNPRILILDEPTAGLDTQATNDLLKIIKDLNKTGTTIIMVTHQMEQVASCANHVIAMSNGQIVADTTPQQLFSNAQRLNKLSLTLPVSVEIAQFLSKNGVTLKNTEPLTLDGLADEITEAMRRKENE
ncbi:energy-coupling factor transporter ATPase [Limosilactobacillus agrestis]|uniref:Energy-coupling factor transporter ATP-binding protein EcfA2 n=1 Tax=Limosilactobacillus agrestis TaxID=2759748 RepID=A0ABS8R613_9LACO|nr:energy-coupling factor transporter ATPase [Limosilactobacillus agrestis]MBB1098788.1 energy-coupling factor transporter ATPase [Limosilactobacillus agrestis]MCD7113587.1 energy-coupling factor transporter ATPase [Limosilactobacillus agrestis]MCD7125753.1 energy-coupling factor transporter ATPase [Limosilactobacillus agrestis]MCD7130211.1 energy-coupling factor transporter ATPase [Limosilactobacillus agrestis]